jgi:hypothetical protein
LFVSRFCPDRPPAATRPDSDVDDVAILKPDDDSFLAQRGPSNVVIVMLNDAVTRKIQPGGGTDPSVLISVVALSFFITRILPVRSSQFEVSDGGHLGASCGRYVDSKNRQETQTLTAPAGVVAGVSDMHATFLCVASISLIVDAAD